MLLWFFKKYEYLFKFFPRDISSIIWIHLSEGVNNSVLLLLRTEGWFATTTQSSRLAELLPLSLRKAGCLLLFSRVAVALSRLLLQSWQVRPVDQVGPHREVEEVLLVDEAVSVAESES